MNEEPTHLTYTKELENILSSQGEKCLCYRWLHDRAEALTSYRNRFIALPVIILSTLTGAASIGSATLFANNVQLASIVIGSISLGVGVLNTVGEFFAFAKRAEGHRYASNNYSKLYRFLQIELALAPEERMSARDLLKTTRDQLQRLEEVSPQIPQSIINEFQRRFPKADNPELSMPEITNGLEPIYVYVAPPPQPLGLILSAPSSAVSTPNA